VPVIKPKLNLKPKPVSAPDVALELELEPEPVPAPELVPVPASVPVAGHLVTSTAASLNALTKGRSEKVGWKSVQGTMV
jgi:hypothetical protein